MKRSIQIVSIISISLILMTGLTSCSSKDTVQHKTSAAEKNFSFYDYSDGSKVHYQVGFDKKNNITELYIDGKEIPSSEYDDYENLISDKLYELDGKKKHSRVFSYHSDLPMVDSADDNVYHFYKFRWDDSSLSHIPKLIVPNWKDSSFKEHMKKMNKEIAKLKDVKIELNFDKEGFRKQMEILRRDLSQLRINDELKNLKEELKSVTEELKEIKIPDEIIVDIPDIEIDMKELDRKLSNLDKEMSKLKVELGKLDSFMKELKSELRKDKFIEDEEEDISIDLNSERMKVNDKEVPENLHKKYKEMYKKHFGKELSGDQSFQIR